MLLLFALVFALAANFSILFFITFPSDREWNSKSMDRTLRPFYLIVIAIILWAMTYPMLLAPDQITTVGSSNSLAGNVLYTFTTSNNYPLATQSFYAYLPIWIAILSIHLVVLVLYILEWTADTFEEQVMNK